MHGNVDALLLFVAANKFHSVVTFVRCIAHVIL